MNLKRPFYTVLILVAIAVVLLAGCNSAQPESTPTPVPAETVEDAPADTSAAALAGTSWVLESLGSGEGQIAVLPEQQPTLGFLVERYGGDSGCNFYLGVYNANQSNLLMESPARTGAICTDTPEVQGQENVFMSSLATVAAFAVVDDKLEMYSSSDQLMLTLAPLDPAPLQGTLWSLQFFNVETQWQANLVGAEITMRIDGGQLSGSAGCNDYTATVSEESGALTISDLAVTEMACLEPEGVMEQETLYLSLLEQAALLRQFPVSLQLLDINGAPLLLYGAE